MAEERKRVHATLFVPGSPPDLAGWGRALGAQGLSIAADVLCGPALPFEVDVLHVENPRDGSFGKAFSFGTATEAEQRAIDAAPGALVLSLPVDLHRARGEVVTLVRALAACGALAVRVEESKLGYPVARWLELVGGTDPWSLYRAVVVLLGNERAARTCGMHAFSLPDAQVALEAFDPAAANALLGSLNVFQLVEDPVLLSGHTFSPSRETPPRVLDRWPDDEYEEGHACHNPFGVWRLGAEGTSGAPAPQLAFVFMPQLRVLLEAAEEKAGRPLTREAVEAITSRAVGITMKHEDARTLERHRGWTDLDPRRAWEQWQALRRRA